MIAKQTLKLSFADWVTLSRPPFHSVGVLPFCLGALMAWRMENIFSADIFFLGVFAVFLIMLSTYQAGEYFDLREDTISKAIFPSRFAGGSGVMPTRRVSGNVPLWTSILAFFGAGVIGIILQFVYQTGPYTLLLGAIGALSGFFYSSRPIRIVETGLGECIIGICYGWLPVAAAFYIQTAYIHPLIHWIAMPIALSIFNVILINEFPDYEADQQVGKRNLLVRLGKSWGKGIYITFSIASWIAMLLSVHNGVSGRSLYLYLPVMLVSMTVIWMLAAKKDRNRKTLEDMCGLTIVVNLGTTASYLLAFWT